MSKEKKLETIEDVINYVKEADCLLVRNLESDTAKHWVENWDEGDPETIEITEELYLECFNDENFDYAHDTPNKENEFYLMYYGFSK